MRTPRRVAFGRLGLGRLVLGGAVGTFAVLGRRRLLHWGATPEEVAMTLPGDELLFDAHVTSTRAITIHADAASVWPWVAQLGQGRGGFYSYDALENVIGCHIHSADELLPGLSTPEVGAEVRLHPEVAMTVAVVDVGRALVITGAVPMGSVTPPYESTWAFVLIDGPDGTTRLVVREAYHYLRPWAALIIEPVTLVSFVMSQKMLRGIRDRAERAQVLPTSGPMTLVPADPAGDGGWMPHSRPGGCVDIGA